MKTTMPLETVPTQFVEAVGTRFAYRRLGPRDGTPLACSISGTDGRLGPRYRECSRRRLIRYICGGIGIYLSRKAFSPSTASRNFAKVDFEGGQVIAASSVSIMFSIVEG